MTTFASRRSRALAGFVGVVALLAAGAADARAGRGGSSMGSSGRNTYRRSARHAHGAGRWSAHAALADAAAGPEHAASGTVPQTQAAQPRRFGFGTGLFAGLLGAGLLGMLFGNGFLGGLAGLASFLGLILQIGLIVGLVWLAVRFFRRRQEPALASAGPQGPMARSTLDPTPPGRGGLGGALGGAWAGSVAAPLRRGRASAATRSASARPTTPPSSARCKRSPMPTGRQDVATLWTLVTPEMAGYLQEELNDDAQNGILRKGSGVRLLQGDLAEAWREGDTDYATVAMRFSIAEVTIDKATGRIVSGDANSPIEATEVWTFRRDRGGAMEALGDPADRLSHALRNKTKGPARAGPFCCPRRGRRWPSPARAPGS